MEKMATIYSNKPCYTVIWVYNLIVRLHRVDLFSTSHSLLFTIYNLSRAPNVHVSWDVFAQEGFAGN